MIEVKDLNAFLAGSRELPLVDVRSGLEYEKGHIPGSINIPLLTNEDRVQVGTLYKQMGKEAAVMKGFQLAGPRFYDLFKAVRKAANEKQVNLYCWRGGMRSNIVAWMMNLSDYKVGLLSGGYKSYRLYAHQLFAGTWNWIKVSGKTGVGKTALLRQLAQLGEQVLDYEGLANHKGSSFGHIGMPPQPTVEHFENLIAWQMKHFDPRKPIWIENESRFIGQVRIPDPLYNQALRMPVIELELDDAQRRKLIWDDYGKQPVTELVEATERLVKKLGGDRVRAACADLESGNWQGWLDVLLPYYDKTYAHGSKAYSGKIFPLTITGDGLNDVNKLLELKNEIWMK
jgi:tRNA 2-selenouridine synthase